MTVTYGYNSSTTSGTFDTSITEMFDQTGASVDYTVIGEGIKIK